VENEKTVAMAETSTLTKVSAATFTTRSIAEQDDEGENSAKKDNKRVPPARIERAIFAFLDVATSATRYPDNVLGEDL
jgi:hypothetical protein